MVWRYNNIPEYNNSNCTIDKAKRLIELLEKEYYLNTKTL